ncbi:MAG TPA: SMP-30/gluconolactonase/LRE family protein [Bryobacteraceae bacterium]|nr:SMP-30/gluconolactonase/LRE family protein [Bryobacteraceae bacterium]
MSKAFLAAADAPATLYTIHTAAGNDLVGDGGPALAALLSQTEGVAVDRAGTIYVADADDNRIRKITPDGVIQTAAGTGVAGFAGDGGPANAALLDHPYGLAVDPTGNLYIADLGNARVRKVSLDGAIQTIAGGGTIVPGGNGDGGPASSAQLLEPRNVAWGPDGMLYISDFGANRVLQVSPAGILTTAAGTGKAGFSGDGAAAQSAQLRAPAGVACDSNGVLYIADSGNNRIRKVAHGVISTVTTVAAPTGIAIASSGSLYIAAAGYFGTLTKAVAGVSTARDVAADAAGDIYFTTGQLVREVSAGGVLTTIAGSGAPRYFGGDNGPAALARMHAPSGVALDAAGNLYVADTANHRIRKITPAGVITTIAGTGVPGAKGDNGQATQAQLHSPRGVALDSLQNIYVADTGNNAVRGINPSGVITTVLDQLNDPEYVAAGPDQTLYIADAGNNRILKLTASGIQSALVLVAKPAALLLDRAGDLFFSGQTSVFEITPAGVLSTVWDGLEAPRGLALTSDGDLLIAETGANVVRRVTFSGTMTTIAGTGAAGFSGDDGVATAARLNAPADLAVDPSGILWIADAANNRLRTLTPSAAPADSSAGVTILNAATLAPGPIAPGEIMTILGAGFQPDQVLFDGQPALILHADASQITALAPQSLAPDTPTKISVFANGVETAVVTSDVVAASPGIFTVANGTGQAAATNEDGSLNSSSNPAARGSVISVFATGQGSAANAVDLTIGGYHAELQYAGPALSGAAGRLEIDARIPGGFLGPGIQPVVLWVGSAPSQSGVTIAVQ